MNLEHDSLKWNFQQVSLLQEAEGKSPSDLLWSSES